MGLLWNKYEFIEVRGSEHCQENGGTQLEHSGCRGLKLELLKPEVLFWKPVPGKPAARKRGVCPSRDPPPTRKPLFGIAVRVYFGSPTTNPKNEHLQYKCIAHSGIGAAART